MNSVSQMPVILLPLHFDRDQALRIPSCQRSIVLRPFCTRDFMTGMPAVPGKQLPLDVGSVSLVASATLTCVISGGAENVRGHIKSTGHF
jgi:hypothetical protein